MTEKFTFFFGHRKSMGDLAVFSNWYPAKFKEENVQYENSEQYMMAKKAELFGDQDTLNKIMNTPNGDPKKVKLLGRQVKNFNQSVWENNHKQIVKTGNILKFTQNPRLLKILISTDGTTLVEASPYDKIWGIGLSSTDPRSLHRSTWQGKNLLGQILTEIRQELKLNLRSQK